MLLPPTGVRRLCQARDLLRASADDDAPTIADIAKRVGMSRAHFIRQFAAVFGVTPHQCRVQTRLDHARALLRTGEHSVTDVCMTVGFSSLGSFSTLFTRCVGESPSAYRRRMRVHLAVPGSLARVVHPGCLTLLACLPPDRTFGEAAACREVAHSPDRI